LQERIKQASKLGKNKKRIKLDLDIKSKKDVEILIEQFEIDMRNAAENLEFEKAIEIREKIIQLQKLIF
jgi:excinuclease UvrABC helicase subunit UvrB